MPLLSKLWNCLGRSFLGKVIINDIPSSDKEIRIQLLHRDKGGVSEVFVLGRGGDGSVSIGFPRHEGQIVQARPHAKGYGVRLGVSGFEGSGWARATVGKNKPIVDSFASGQTRDFGSDNKVGLLGGLDGRSPLRCAKIFKLTPLEAGLT